ncbi:hypothetical protein LVO79_20165 (plasmid) [Roseivivax marinus]|uniref:flagellar basal body-associated FliL family protein n=1 Tax=Roseivivax marinus TaxID=1379903 RepID=UPI001F03CB80|nr:flagellar basal body-associated FliL family protein [Roseivivax marinus]UMA66882.1 hypothetical protein LVO79_20165 [Roseivivax marinus]
MAKTLLLYAGLPALSVVGGLFAGPMLADARSDTPPAVVEAGDHAAATQAEAEAPQNERTYAAAAKEGRAVATLANVGPDVSGRVVRLGRMTIPVHRPNTVSYVVTDIGVSMRDPDMAEAFRDIESGMLLRDAILTALSEAASLPMMKTVSIDTDALSAFLSERLSDFDGVEDVLFLTFYKADVPRA